MFEALIGTRTRASLSSITNDPLYDEKTTQYDFSILTLAQPVTFSSTVAPACLPWDTNQTYVGQADMYTVFDDCQMPIQWLPSDN